MADLGAIAIIIPADILVRRRWGIRKPSPHDPGSAFEGGHNILAAHHKNMGDVQISTTFTENVREWVQLNDVKAQAAKDISRMIKRIKELKEGIMTYMSAHEIGTVNINGERVKLIHTKSKDALSQEVLNDLIARYFKEHGDSTSASKADQIAHYIMDKRGVTTKPSIRRNKAKAGRGAGEGNSALWSRPRGRGGRWGRGGGGRGGGGLVRVVEEAEKLARCVP